MKKLITALSIVLVSCGSSDHTKENIRTGILNALNERIKEHPGSTIDSLVIVKFDTLTPKSVLEKKMIYKNGIAQDKITEIKSLQEDVKLYNGMSQDLIDVKNNQINGLIAECKALSSEIDQLKTQYDTADSTQFVYFNVDCIMYTEEKGTAQHQLLPGVVVNKGFNVVLPKDL